MNPTKLAVFAAASLFVLGGTACDRGAKNKIVAGTNASQEIEEVATVQAVEDVWSIASIGSALGTAQFAPGVVAAPEGTSVETAFAAPASGAIGDSVAICQAAFSAAGFSGPGSDGFYTISRSLGSGISGVLKIGFLNAAGGLVNFCSNSTSVTGTRIRYSGFVGFGGGVNLDLSVNGTTTPTLNGTITATINGQLFQMNFTNCVYSASGRSTPSSGSWTGSFGSTRTGTWLLNVQFSSTGGSGTLLGGGKNYRVRISTGGVLTITE